MKNNDHCSRCNSTEIEDMLLVDGGGLYVGALSRPIQTRAWVCLDCGYVEHWIEDKQELLRLRDKLQKQAIEDSVPDIMTHYKHSSDDEKESIECMQCGADIPASETTCQSCGWSYA